MPAPTGESSFHLLFFVTINNISKTDFQTQQQK